MRYYIVFILSLMISTPFLCAIGAHDDKKYRMPSKVWENIKIMRETVFKPPKHANIGQDYRVYIEVEEDVKKYVRFELDRLKNNNVKIQGLELYYLGEIYAIAEEFKNCADTMKEFIEDSKKPVDKTILLNSHYTMVKALIELEDTFNAEKRLSYLTANNAKKLDPLYFKLSCVFMEKNQSKKALEYAKKLVCSMDPGMAFYYADLVTTHFTANDMIINAHLVIDMILDILSKLEQSDTRKLIENKRKQLGLIGKKAPYAIEDMANNLKLLPPHQFSAESNKAILIYYWAYWCNNSLQKLQGLWKKYKTSGFNLMGVTKPYGYGFYSNNALKRTDQKIDLDQEIAMLVEMLKTNQIQFANFMDSDQRVEQSFHVNPPPHFILVDSKGSVVLSGNPDAFQLKELEDAIKSLLKTE